MSGAIWDEHKILPDDSSLISTLMCADSKLLDRPIELSVADQLGHYIDWWPNISLTDKSINDIQFYNLGPLLLTWFNFNPSMDM